MVRHVKTSLERLVDLLLLSVPLGQIDFNEFVEVFADYYFKKFTRAEIRSAFRTFDRDGDGFIEHSELRRIFVKLGYPFSDAEVIKEHFFSCNLTSLNIHFYSFRSVESSLMLIEMEMVKFRSMVKSKNEEN